MTDRKKPWWDSLVVGTDGTTINESAPSEIAPIDTTAPNSWVDQYLPEGEPENAEDKWYSDWESLLSRIGFESTGAAAAVRMAAPVLQSMPPGLPRVAATAGTAAAGGWLGKEADTAVTGNVMPGDESVMSDLTSLAGGSLQRVPSTVAGNLLRSGMGQARDVADQLTDLGVDYTPGITSDWSIVKGLEQVMTELPITGGVTRAKLNEIYAQFDSAVKHLTDDATIDWGEDIVDLGVRIQRSAESKIQHYNDRTDQLYNILWNPKNKSGLMPASTRVSTANTINKLNDYGGTFSDEGIREVLGVGWMEKLRVLVAQRDTMSWADMDALRMAVGRHTKGMKTDGNDPAIAKQLYAAILDDMEIAAEQTSPLANKAFRNARRYWKLGGEAAANLQKAIVDKDPQKLVEGLMTNRTTDILRARKASTPEVWNGVQAAVVKQLGKAAPGAQTAAGDVFSPRTFLTNYNKLQKTSDKAVKRLFGEAGQYRGINEQLKTLAELSEKLASSQLYGNPSGTARVLQQINLATSVPVAAGAAIAGSAVWGDVASAAGAVAGSVAGLHGTAKLWTNKRFLDWLIRGVSVTKNTQAAQDWVSSMPMFAGAQWLSSQDHKFLGDIKNSLFQWMPSARADVPSVPQTDMAQLESIRDSNNSDLERKRRIGSGGGGGAY